MKTWAIRFIGMVFVLVAGYFAFTAVHAAPLILACSAATTAIALLAVVLLWNRPVIGSSIAAAVLILGLLAQIVVLPHAQNGVTSTTVLQGATNSTQTDTSAQYAGTAGGASALADSFGPEQVDAGDGGGNTPGQQVSKAANAVLGAFGGSPQPVGNDADAQRLRSLAADISPETYSLTALAATLPNDPVQLFQFVRDNVGTDLYDGIMRGPIGTWMSKRGSSSDKLMLLGWLLVTKGIPVHVMRSTLSDAERAQIAADAQNSTDAALPSDLPPEMAAYISKRATDGTVFASWASGLLQQKGIALGTMPEPAQRVGAQHYFIRIMRNGTPLDLDPTLHDAVANSHLGAIDNSFAMTALPPAEEWHTVTETLTATLADGSQKQIFTHGGPVSQIAYSPVWFSIVPKGATDLSTIGKSTVFDVTYVSGSTPNDPVTLDLGSGSSAITSLVLEIDRKGPGIPQTVTRRWLLPPGTPADQRVYAVAGLHTMLVIPGAEATAFALREQMLTLATLYDVRATIKSGAQPQPLVMYPFRIADFFGRDDLIAQSVGSAKGIRLFRSRPDVAMQHITFIKTSDGSAKAQVVFDIVDNAMSSTGDGIATVNANLMRGYADTQLEKDVALQGDTAANVSPNTITVFNAAQTQGIAPTVYANASSVAATSSAIASNDSSLGLAETVGNGETAIAPARSVATNAGVSFGWWAIDPQTGNTVGRMTGGYGDMAEYGILLRRVSFALFAYEAIGTVHECSEAGWDSLGCAAEMCALTVSLLFMYAGGKHALTATKFLQEEGASHLVGSGCKAATHFFGAGGNENQESGGE